MFSFAGFIHTTIKTHKLLWGRLVWERWNTLSLENKIICLLIANNLIAIITAFEILILK